MKQFLLLLLLIPVCMIGTLHAQSGVVFGAKAGAQLTNFTHISDGKAAIQYHAGGFVDVSLMERLSAQAEILLSAQGINDSESDYFKQRNLYLQVPVLVKFRIWNGLSIHTGASAGYLLSAKRKIDDGEDPFSYDTKEDYHKFGVNGLVGAEYLVTPKLGVGLRMNWGLGKVFKEYDRSRERVYQVFASYRFGNREF